MRGRKRRRRARPPREPARATFLRAIAPELQASAVLLTIYEYYRTKNDIGWKHNI